MSCPKKLLFVSLCLGIVITGVSISRFSKASASTITVNADVPPSPTDMQATLISVTSGSTFPQYTILTYQIAYGSTLPYATPLTVQAEWSQGTVAGAPSPSVDLLDYVSGSAGKAYGNTSAIIDTVNRTVTWNISSFPADTSGQTITFQLKLNDSYQGSETVSYDVSGRAIVDNVQTPDSTISQKYLYDPSIMPTPTPTEIPTSTPTAAPTPTPKSSSGKSSAPASAATPTPTNTPTSGSPSQANLIQTVEVTQIATQSAAIRLTFASPVTVSISYGMSPTFLNKKVTALTPAAIQILTLSSLTHATQYYFKVTATPKSGKPTVSDIYTFTTAKARQVVSIRQDTFTVTGDNILLYNGSSQIGSQQNIPFAPTIVVPVSTPFDFQFSVANPSDVKAIEAIARNSRILGLSSFIGQADANAEANTSGNNVTLVEIAPGIYTGRLSTTTSPGYYDLFIRIQDVLGNISEQKIATIKVPNKMSVVTQKSKIPIEKARVNLFIYDPETRLYTELNPQTSAIDNPVFSDPDGTVPLVLPAGKYRADVSADDFKAQTVDFTIGPNPGEDYPTVALGPEPFTLMGFLNGLASTGSDFLAFTQQYIVTLSESGRYFSFMSFVVSAFLVLLTLFSLRARLKVPLKAIPEMIHYHRHLSGQTGKSIPFHGIVIDETTKRPLARVSIFLIDGSKIYWSATTDTAGGFSLPLSEDRQHTLVIMKNGYEETRYTHDGKQTDEPVTIAIRNVNIGPGFFALLMWVFDHLLADSFEFLLLFSVLTELLLGYSLGWTRALPFIGASVINVALWFIYVKRHTLKKPAEIAI